MCSIRHRFVVAATEVAVAEAANRAVAAAAVQVRGFVVKAQKVVDAFWNIEVQQQEQQYQ